ncbi:MAG: 1,4-alpha-glucan branching protein domain-containing protein [Opitutales bacterium]
MAFVLHAHLPWAKVADGELPLRWHGEAYRQVYAPLLDLLEQLPGDSGPWLTVSLSPSLLETWAQPDWPEALRRSIDEVSRGIALLGSAGLPDAPLEALRTELAAGHQRLAANQADPAKAFASEAAQYKVELWSSTATHALLPVMHAIPGAVRAQMTVAQRCFETRIGRQARGLWLPECGWSPDLLPALEAAGVPETVVDHTDDPDADFPAPQYCPTGLTVWPRQRGLSEAVWSARVGYPGHPAYREFHRDAADVFAHLNSDDASLLAAGLKCWSVTGKAEKDWYHPARATEQAKADADAFVERLERLAQKALAGRPPLVVLPFDAELFGHWWFEGPQWLSRVLERTHDRAGRLQATTPGAYRQCYGAAPAGHGPPPSSWGRGGDFRQWVNARTSWIYPPLTSLADTELRTAACALNSLHPQTDPESEAARHWLLAQASDWPFMLSNNVLPDLAEARLRHHFKEVESRVRPRR